MADPTNPGPALPEEPEGWRELQEKAQRERDPKKLAALIDKMNELLTEWEKKAAGEEGKSRVRRTDVPRP